MLKICLLGSTGLLGKSISTTFNNCENIQLFEVARTSKKYSLDIADDKALIDFFEKHNFDIVINTVALVNHELCEQNKELAYKVNARPSSILANLATKHNFKYIYISTDAYFNNDKNAKHDENAEACLLNEYARTKYAGEKFALTNPQSLAIRTNIVGFKGEKNNPTFLEWAIHALKNQEEIILFDDYFTSSISVSQFSQILLDILPHNLCGILNIASSEVFSKKDFIEKLAKEFNFSLSSTKIGKVSSISSSQRGNSLGLNVQKVESLLNYPMPTLNSVISQLKKEYKTHV